MLDKTVDGKYTLIGLKEKGRVFQSHLAHYHLLGTQVMVDLIYPGRLEGKADSLTSRLDALLTLRAPGISRVFAWGEEEDYLFVVREFVPGTLLSELLQESGDLPFTQVLSLLRSLVDGMGALHGRGIYFLGLNPHQIWIGRDGSAGIVRPGYSFLLEYDDERLSREAAPYWAPEVLAGEEGTRASDIFSLGMMARRMLTSLRDQERLWKMLCETSAFEAARRPPSARVFLERVEEMLLGSAENQADRAASVEAETGPPVKPPAKLEKQPAGSPVKPPTMQPVKPPACENGYPLPVFPVPAPTPAPTPDLSGGLGPLSPQERLTRLIGPDSDFDAEPSHGRLKKRRLLKLGGAAAAVALVGALLFSLAKPSTGTSETVAVSRPSGDAGTTYSEQQLVMPDLRGMDSAQARRLLHEMGLEVEIVSEPSNVVPEGKVIIQEPMKGETMRKGYKVKVYVSKGPLQQQQTTGPGCSDNDIRITSMRDLLPGRGSAIEEPRGPGGPEEPTTVYPESRGHGA